MNSPAPAPPATIDVAFLHSVLAASEDCIKVLTPAGNIVFVNTAGARLLEAENPESLVGKLWPDFWYGSDRNAASQALRDAATMGRGAFRGPAPTVAGSLRWWDVRITPILSDDGQPNRLLAISRDITTAKLAEDALREAQGLNTPLLNSNLDCIVVLDLDGVTLFVSPGGLEAMEIADPAAVIGLSWVQTWTGDERRLAQAAIATARAGGVARFEGFCPTHAGRAKWWDVVITPLAGPDGLPERLVTIGRDVTDRRLADDRALRLAGLVEQSRDFIGVANPAGEVLYLNQAGCALVGVSPAQAQGAAVTDFIAPGNQAVTAGIMPGVAKDGFWEGELDFRHFATGAILPVLFNVFPLRDASGALSGYGTVTRDLREARQALARRMALLELGDQLRELADAGETSRAAAAIIGTTLGVSSAGYGTMSSDGGHMLVDAGWAAPGAAPADGVHRLLEFSAIIEELRAGTAVVIADTLDDPRTAAGAAALQASGAAAFVSMPIVEAGVLVAVIFAIDARPRPWLAEDVTFIRNVAQRTRVAIERRRAEQALRELAQSLERQVAQRTADRNRLWQLSSDIMLAARTEGTILAVNPAWTRILGWTADEVLDGDLFALVHPDDQASAREMTRDTIVSPMAWTFENRVRCQDGSYRWISWSFVLGGGAINAVGRDVTLQQQQAAALLVAEERLRQSQKMEAVGQLTGGLAHDFNNLLTGISGSLELIGARMAQGRYDSLPRFVEAAQASARRAASVTHRLLAFSRRQTLDARPVHLDQLVAGMEEMIARTVGPAISLTVRTAAMPCMVLADASQLENALLNLCINARDAMPDGGALEVEAALHVFADPPIPGRELPPGAYAVLRVSDTGIGMTAEVAARAFDPFFTTKAQGQGTGLGLSMIYGFARQSGGEVRIASTPGRGTTMTIYLPSYDGPAEPIKPAAAIDPACGRGEHILVVDDEPAILMLVSEVLEERGYRVTGAATGAEGLTVLQAGGRCDLLITDVGLPGGMNGRQLADAARLMQPGLRVLYVTGYAETAVLGPVPLGEDTLVLVKPFVIDALAARVRALLMA